MVCTLTAVPQRVGDGVHLAVGDGAVVHPRAEHGGGGAPELLARVFGEVLADAVVHGLLELGDELLEVVGGELGVDGHAAALLHLVETLLERVGIVFVDRLAAQHDVAVHLTKRR